MAKKGSIQKRLETERPPRVQLTYDVEVGDAIEKKELPFVVGVLGDFTGNRKYKPDPAKLASHDKKVREKEEERAKKEFAKLRDRKFVNIDRDNFDEVLDGMAPHATFRVKNRIGTEDGEFSVDLAFRKLDDFRPEAVVAQVEPLRKLLERRTMLSDLRNKMAGNEKLVDLLTDVMEKTEKLNQLRAGSKKDKE